MSSSTDQRKNIESEIITVRVCAYVSVIVMYIMHFLTLFNNINNNNNKIVYELSLHLPLEKYFVCFNYFLCLFYHKIRKIVILVNVLHNLLLNNVIDYLC